jgi:hypothetical protein
VILVRSQRDFKNLSNKPAIAAGNPSTTRRTPQQMCKKTVNTPLAARNIKRLPDTTDRHHHFCRDRADWSACWPKLRSHQGVTVRVADFVVPLSLADTVTDVEAVTVVVVTVKVAVVAPAGTVTLAGSDAAALLSDNVTTVPAEGAGPVKVTVPVEEVPPVTLEGLSVREVRAERSTVKVAVLVVPLSTAEIVTEVLADTGVVVIVNVAVVAPAATVTLAGNAAADV